jgi:hypothetical protein
LSLTSVLQRQAIGLAVFGCLVVSVGQLLFYGNNIKAVSANAVNLEV